MASRWVFFLLLLLLLQGNKDDTRMILSLSWSWPLTHVHSPICLQQIPLPLAIHRHRHLWLVQLRIHLCPPWRRMPAHRPNRLIMALPLPPLHQCHVPHSPFPPSRQQRRRLNSENLVVRFRFPGSVSRARLAITEHSLDSTPSIRPAHFDSFDSPATAASR